jgi:coatomer subunit gamma
VELSYRDYIKAVNVGNWRHAWDQLPSSTERAEDYGLGPKDRLEDAVEATLSALGMACCEGTDLIPPNSRSHTALLSGAVLGGSRVLARVQFGMDAARNVAMKVISRAEDDGTAELVHLIIQNS